MSLCRGAIWRRVAVFAAVASVLVPASFTFAVLAAPDDGPAPQKAEAATGDRPKFGLQLNDSKAFQGYTLIAPLNSKKSYLIDMEGRVVRVWRASTRRARRPTSLRMATSSAPPRSTLESGSLAAPARGGESRSSTGTATSSGTSSSTTRQRVPTTRSAGFPTATCS